MRTRTLRQKLSALGPRITEARLAVRHARESLAAAHWRLAVAHSRLASRVKAKRRTVLDTAAVMKGGLLLDERQAALDALLREESMLLREGVAAIPERRER